MHHKLSQIRCLGRKLHTTPGLLHGQALCSWGGLDPAAGLAKGYIPFIARSHLGDHILQTRSPRCSSTLWRAEQAELPPPPPPTPTRCGRREESEPPVRASRAHRGRGQAAFLRSSPPGPREAGGVRGLANTEVGGAALCCRAHCGSPRSGPWVWSGQRARGPPPLPRVPRPPATWWLEPAPACSPPRGPRAKLELVRPPAPALRPHRRRRRARLTTALRLYCVSYGDQLGGSGERSRPLPPALGRG